MGRYFKTAATLSFALSLALPGLALAQVDDQVEVLETVVVTGSRTETSIREITSNITVITQKELEKYPDSSLTKILMREGFTVNEWQGGQRTSELFIRGIRSGGDTIGGQGARILFLVDGRPALTYNLGQLTKTNVERIEIIRGSAALIYGSQAAGGVVNIITVRGEGDLSAHVRAGFNSHGIANQEGGFSGRIGDFDYSAGLYHDQIPEKAASDSRGTHFPLLGDKGLYSGSMNLGYNFLEDRHRIGFIVNYNDINTQGTGVNTFLPGLDGGTYDRNNQVYDLLYTGRTEDDFLNWAARYYQGEDAYKFYGMRDRNDPGILDNFNDSKAETDGLQAQLTVDWDIVELTGGVDWQGVDITKRSSIYDLASLPDRTLTGDTSNTGAFLTGKLRLMDENLIFTGGVRYDDFEFNSLGNTNAVDNWSTTVGAAYHPTDWLKLRANYAKGFRAPSVEEMLGEYLAYGDIYLGNPNLEPEYSTNYEFGFDVNTDYWNLNATYFITDYDNFISNPYGNIRVGIPAITQNLNDPNDVTNAGIEFGTSFDVGSYFGWGTEVTPYLKGTWYTERKQFIENTDGNGFREVTTQFVPDKSVVYGVDMTIPEWEMFVNINASYVGKRRVNRTVDNVVGAPLRDSRSYTTVDMTVDKVLVTFADKNKISVNFAAYNMFDRYVEPASHDPKTFGPRDDFLLPAATVYMGLRYDYN